MMTLNLSAITIAACIAPVFAGEGWLTDLDAGKKQAAAENKAVLVEFTGSDWCHYCIELRKNVLNKPEFMQYALKNFVLVELDFPETNPQLRQKNEPWAKQYQIDCFPTVLVLDADGAVYGGFFGGIPNFAAAKEPLDEALQTMKTLKDNLAVAQKLTGDDKIKALGKAYLSIPKEYRSSHVALVKQITDLDKNDITGIVEAEKKAAADKALYDKIQQELDDCKTPQEANDKIQQELGACKTPQETLATAETYLAQKDLPEEAYLALIQAKLKVLLTEARNDADFDKALAFLDEIAKIDTEHTNEIAEFKANLSKHKDEIIKHNTSRTGAPQQ